MAGHTSARPGARFTGLSMALLAVVLVAGCGDSGESDGAATSTATASVSETTEPPIESPSAEPTATSALPPLPAEATENTPEGAEAFIRYYFDVANQAFTTPQSGLIPSLANDDCESCADLEQQVVDFERQGLRATTDPYNVESMSRVGGSPQDVTLFNMVVQLPATSTITEDGVESQPSEAATYKGTGAAIWAEGKWELLGLELQSS